MRTAWPCAALLFFFVAACRPQPSTGVPPAAVTVSPAPGGGDPVVHGDPSPHPEPPAPPSPPLPGALGKSCSTLGDAGAQTPGRHPELRCGTRGRIALEIDHATVSLLRADVACGLRLRPGEQIANSERACLDGDRLYAGAQCIMCRLMDAGWSARAIVSELTPDDARELANLLKLGLETPLRNAADWRQALDRADFGAAAQP